MRCKIRFLGKSLVLYIRVGSETTEILGIGFLLESEVLSKWRGEAFVLQWTNTVTHKMFLSSLYSVPQQI